MAGYQSIIKHYNLSIESSFVSCNVTNTVKKKPSNINVLCHIPPLLSGHNPHLPTHYITVTYSWQHMQRSRFLCVYVDTFKSSHFKHLIWDLCLIWKQNNESLMRKHLETKAAWCYKDHAQLFLLLQDGISSNSSLSNKTIETKVKSLMRPSSEGPCDLFLAHWSDKSKSISWDAEERISFIS